MISTGNRVVTTSNKESYPCKSSKFSYNTVIMGKSFQVLATCMILYLILKPSYFVIDLGGSNKHSLSHFR